MTTQAQMDNANSGATNVFGPKGFNFTNPPVITGGNTSLVAIPAFVHGGNEHEHYFFHPDHLGSSNYITNFVGEVSQHSEYFAFGETFIEEHKNSHNSPYKFNGKELDEESGLYYYGARYYDPRISIWASVDPLAEKYPGVSPYNYCLNNPLFYVDPDGREVIISYKVGDENKTMNYSYVKDRKFEDGTPDFVKNTVMALDQLHSTGAMNITFGEGDKAKTIDVLGKFIGSKVNNITIMEGAENQYTASTNTIEFNSTKGIEFRKDLSLGFSEENTGRNSASSLLGHEIIHGYNDEIDNDNYINRKSETYADWKTVAPYFPNKEEKEVTTNYANQVNKVLKQDQRTHYKRNYYNTESPTSTKKKTP